MATSKYTTTADKYNLFSNSDGYQPAWKNQSSTNKTSNNLANSSWINKAVTNANLIKNSRDTGATWVTDKGNKYTVYQDKNGTYFIIDKNGDRSDFTNKKSIALLDSGEPITFSKANRDTLYNDMTAAQNAAKKASGGGGGYYGSGGGKSSGKGSDSYYEKLLDEYKEKIDALENPKVWTSDELAEHFGVTDQYNMDYLNRMYNDATNKYYEDAIANQIQNKKDSELSTAAYANNLLNKYLNSYKYAAPTAVGRGTLAANALSAMINNDMSSEENSANLNSIINDYREQQKAELANNANLARQQYNNIGTWLLDRGTQNNTSEVQNYINSLNAYDTAYSGIRNAQNNLASTAAAAYNANAQAALTRNAYAASQSGDSLLKRAYELYYGNENNAWQKAYNTTKYDTATTQLQKSSAN